MASRWSAPVCANAFSGPVQSCRNAEYQVRALAISPNIAPLTPGEVQRCGDIVGKTTGVTRSWESWALRVAMAGGGLPAAGKSNSARPSAPAPPQTRQSADGGDVLGFPSGQPSVLNAAHSGGCAHK